MFVFLITGFLFYLSLKNGNVIEIKTGNFKFGISYSPEEAEEIENIETNENNETNKSSFINTTKLTLEANNTFKPEINNTNYGN